MSMQLPVGHKRAIAIIWHVVQPEQDQSDSKSWVMSPDNDIMQLVMLVLVCVL
jgi:hypothetical protein